MEGTLRFQEKLSLIGQIPLFANLRAADKRLIAGASELAEYKKGEIIYRRGEGPDAFYCVVTGRLRAYISRDGREEDLEYLKRGKYFGIISLLTGEPHSVSVQAVNDSVILKIPKEAFAGILKRIPELAIHFSQTLSRRLKTKDAAPKKIFESTIISAYGTSGKVGVTQYLANLAVSLGRETRKKVMLIDLNETGTGAPGLLGIAPPPRIFSLNSSFFDEGGLKDAIYRHDLGVDLLKIGPGPANAKSLIALLSRLTGDYHYLLVDLERRLSDSVFEILKQSDEIHLISASDEANLGVTAKLLDSLTASAGGALSAKIRVITCGYGAKPLPFDSQRRILKRGIFATLPEIDRTISERAKMAGAIVKEFATCEYSRAVKRIARELGDCLIGLALGSGAAMGMAHVGVLKVIEEHKIPIDVLVGTSMGALIGAFWASGKKAEEIEEALSRFRKRIDSLRLVDLAIPKRGLIKGRGVRRFLAGHLGDRTFHDLKFPFKAVACDIEKREEVVIEEGSLVDAVMASVSIPGVFEPVEIGGRLLVDGGIINPLPVSVLMRMGVAKVIAVNTLPSAEDIQRSKKKVTNIFDIIVNSVQASEYLLAEAGCQDADIIMHPVLSDVDWYEFHAYPKVIRRGEEEAMKFLPQLKELAAV